MMWIHGGSNTWGRADQYDGAALAARYSTTNVLVNCVGMVGVGTILDTSPAELEPVVAAYRGRRPEGRFDGLPANPGAARP